MRAIDFEVMAHAFASQNELGNLCDENIYQMNLAARLHAAGISCRSDWPIELTFRHFTKVLRLDLVVADQAAYELKAVSELTTEHENQLLNYLLLVNARRGKLINFRSDSVHSRFVNAPLEATDRHEFTVDRTLWAGELHFEELVTALIADWGTSLELALYIEAITECLGGAETVHRSLPMRSACGPMGSQRFHLVDDHTAFRITSFPRGASPEQAKPMEKLIRPSPLDCLYWVNIARHELRFQTVFHRN